ncbi:MATE family efflux transporter [Methanobrevibacter sp.]|uniref:MATE family efflux transporter n=1 Tax=Methanobrevibacter sp. TaxID=66852 RepID=UPI0025FA0BC3|nr:MATE family efflux transporter [Methanobrevibacter sp.]MBQ2831675.1 polysaccharide biosynthesis C-terminal domain-containing protein [Methanobrevibacter sp.]
MYERNYNLLRAKFSEFFLPTLFTSMAGNICLFVDGLIVSFLIGASNLAPIQIVAPVITFVNLLYWMIGLGGSVLCSVAKAEFDDKKSNTYFSVSIISLISIGLLITAVGLLFSGNIAQFLCSSQPELVSDVAKYFVALIIGMPFLCYMMSLSYFIRADGIPTLPFRAILIANIVNICFDFIYIKFFNMGLSGAALATSTGYLVGSILISYYFLKKERTLEFIKLKVNSFFSFLKKIVTSGFSSASTQLYLTLKLLVINFLVGLYVGKSGVVAFGICYNSLFILYIFLIGTAQTMSPIVSVYFKEEDYSGVNYIIKRSLKIVVASSLALSILFIVYPQALLFLYSVKNPADVPVVLNALRIFAISYVGTAITFLYTFYAQAIQKNQISTVISLLEGFVLPISLAAILSFAIGGNGIWISFAIAELVTILVIVGYSRYTNKKTDGEYSGFFINKHNDDEKVFEHTIKGDIREAVDLARDVQDYLSGNKSATIVGLAIEEMLVNIINTNDEVETIDVIVRDNGDNILISVKDTGIDFNPVVENDKLEFDNISVLNKIADKIDYSRVLGLNSTVITIKN